MHKNTRRFASISDQELERLNKEYADSPIRDLERAAFTLEDHLKKTLNRMKSSGKIYHFSSDPIPVTLEDSREDSNYFLLFIDTDTVEDHPESRFRVVGRLFPYTIWWEDGVGVVYAKGFRKSNDYLEFHEGRFMQTYIKEMVDSGYFYSKEEGRLARKYAGAFYRYDVGDEPLSWARDLLRNPPSNYLDWLDAGCLFVENMNNLNDLGFNPRDFTDVTESDRLHIFKALYDLNYFSEDEVEDLIEKYSI